MEAFFHFVLKALLFLIAAFMILLVLIQRGKGGGLTGALGGMGGQSAFGTKAGDVFTRVTIVVAAIWILLCAAAVKMFKAPTVEDQVAGVGAATTPAPGSVLPTPTAGTPAASTPVPSAPATSTPATPTASPTATGS